MQFILIDTTVNFFNTITTILETETAVIHKRSIQLKQNNKVKWPHAQQHQQHTHKIHVEAVASCMYIEMVCITLHVHKSLQKSLIYLTRKTWHAPMFSTQDIADTLAYHSYTSIAYNKREADI